MTWKSTRIFCGIYKNTGARITWRRGATIPQAEEARPLGRAWQACEPLVAPSPPIPAIYILSRSEKNQGEEFVAFYDTELPPPPVLPLEGRSGVRSGLRRGEIVAIVITNLPSSPIP